MNRLVALTLLVFSSLFYVTPAGASELSTVIQVALKNNYKIRNSEFEVASSEYDKKQKLAVFYPTIDFTANTKWNESQSTPHDTKIKGDKTGSNTNGYGLSLKQNLIDFSLLHDYQSSHLDLELNELKHSKIINDIIVKVVEEYFSYLKFHSQYLATSAEFASSKSRFNHVKRNNELGNIAKTDVYEAYAQKQTNYRKLLDIKKNIEIALLKLKSTTQLAIKPSVDVQLDRTYPKITGSDKQKLRQQMVANNYDIVISRYDIKKIKKSLQKTQANFYPTLTTSVNYQFTDANGGAPGTDSDNMTYSLDLAIPITNGGSDFYAYQKNKQQVEQKNINYEDALDTSEVDFEELYYKINHNVDSIDALRSMIISNYVVFKGTTRAYKIGTKTLTDLLSAESDLYDSIRDFQANQYDYIINITKFKALLGPINLAEIEKLSSTMFPIKNEFDISVLEKFKKEF